MKLNKQKQMKTKGFVWDLFQWAVASLPQLSQLKATLDLTKIFREKKTNTTLPMKRLAPTIYSIWAIHRQVMPEKVTFLSLLNISNEQLLICTL